MAATGKHFPGLGAAPESTDLAVQRIRLARGELRRIDERPYRAFAASDGDMVMISTAIYTHFSHKPAAFSKRIATGELRARLGFEGVSITDALETVSARHFGGPAKVGVAAARAGTDLLLFTDHHGAARAGRALTRRPALGQAGAPTVRGLRPARAGPALPDCRRMSHWAAPVAQRRVIRVTVAPDDEAQGSRAAGLTDEPARPILLRLAGAF